MSQNGQTHFKTLAAFAVEENWRSQNFDFLSLVADIIEF